MSEAVFRDHAILQDIRDTLLHHARLRQYDLDLRVRGGVVHVQGRLQDVSDRELLRQTLSRVKGVNAVWDLVGAGGPSALRLVDVGCGGHKQYPQAIGVDARSLPGVDVVADAERGLPFADNEIDHVFAIHILEHVRDLITVMNELHRIITPGGVLHVMVPLHSATNAIADPTHLRFFNRQTFKYFCRSQPDVTPFRPLTIAVDDGTVFADLQPVKAMSPLPGVLELVRFFD